MTCEQCNYYRVAECYRYPPTMVTTAETDRHGASYHNFISVRTEVNASDKACGEYKTKEQP